MELNLENALQRAKAEKRRIKAAPKLKAASTPEKKNGWKAPVYSQSRKLPVDLKVAEAYRCICALPQQPESDYYRVLRTQIQHISEERDWRAIMVTSTLPGEGKTLTSINLAFAFAKAYHQTVLLVDCDFRRQNIKNYLGLKSNVGLVESLLGDIPLKETIIWPGVEKLAIISGSRTITESSELLASPMMRSTVREMRNRYSDRYLFFDVPPILGGADALAFAPAVDGILLVVGSDGASKKEVRQSLEMIPQDKFLGVVLNRHQGRMPNYLSYYEKT
jgi:non-specific protein-tyrosine kinase